MLFKKWPKEPKLHWIFNFLTISLIFSLKKGLIFMQRSIIYRPLCCLYLNFLLLVLAWENCTSFCMFPKLRGQWKWGTCHFAVIISHQCRREILQINLWDFARWRTVNFARSQSVTSPLFWHWKRENLQISSQSIKLEVSRSIFGPFLVHFLTFRNAKMRVNQTWSSKLQDNGHLNQVFSFFFCCVVILAVILGRNSKNLLSGFANQINLCISTKTFYLILARVCFMRSAKKWVVCKSDQNVIKRKRFYWNWIFLRLAQNCPQNCP